MKNCLAARLCINTEFFPTKLVNGGEGGAPITADDEPIRFASMWRNKGGIFGNYHEVLMVATACSINCIAVENYKNLNFEISDEKRSLKC